MHYFLEMSLNSVDYSNFVSFGTRSKLTRGAMMQIKLQIPSLQEQRRIVNLVESIDNLIQRTDDAIIKSRIARAALLADLLNPGIDEQLREGWTKTTIADIAHVNHESISSVAGNQEIKYIDLSSVSAESGISHELWSGSLADAPGRAKRLVRTDDVLISTVRPYLRGVAKVTADLDGQVASTGFCVLRAIRNVCLPGLLWCYINQDSFFDFLMTRATGSNYPAVRPKDVSEYKLVLPPLEEQLRIAELIEAFDLEIFSLKALLINARNARTAILQDLLSGNHEIPESYDRFLEVS
jgi:type I restriction enzyme S subunit